MYKRQSLGCRVNKLNSNTLEIDASDITTVNACTEDVRRMRASYYFIGALLPRFKKAKVELPGGCPIGVRPIDQHIKGFEALGAEVVIELSLIHISIATSIPKSLAVIAAINPEAPPPTIIKS